MRATHVIMVASLVIPVGVARADTQAEQLARQARTAAAAQADAAPEPPPAPEKAAAPEVCEPRLRFFGETSFWAGIHLATGLRGEVGLREESCAPGSWWFDGAGFFDLQDRGIFGGPSLTKEAGLAATAGRNLGHQVRAGARLGFIFDEPKTFDANSNVIQAHNWAAAIGPRVRRPPFVVGADLVYTSADGGQVGAQVGGGVEGASWWGLAAAGVAVVAYGVVGLAGAD